MTTDKHEELVKRANEAIEYMSEFCDNDVTADFIHSVIADLLAENARLKAAMEWQPIPTPPKEQTR